VLEKQSLDSSCSEDLTGIQLEIRNTYRSILLLYPQIVLRKSIDSMLWKNCFHKKIEEYRKEIKKLTAVLDVKYEDRQGRKVAQSFSQYKSEEKLLQLSSALEQFLAQASAFYQQLIAEFENKREMTACDDLYVTRQIYVCLLCLGDLARYSEIHSTSSKIKDWSVAERYYKRSQQMMPDSGNPYNQVSSRTAAVVMSAQ
jgi:hypothetical protein